MHKYIIFGRSYISNIELEIQYAGNSPEEPEEITKINFTHDSEPAENFIQYFDSNVYYRFDDNLIEINCTTEYSTYELTSILVHNLIPLYLSFCGELLFHGSFLTVNGKNILISGESGTGKSTLTIKALSNNHSVFADETVYLKEVGQTLKLYTGMPVIRSLDSHPLEKVCHQKVFNKFHYKIPPSSTPAFSGSLDKIFIMENNINLPEGWYPVTATDKISHMLPHIYSSSFASPQKSSALTNKAIDFLSNTEVIKLNRYCSKTCSYDILKQSLSSMEG